MTIVKNEMEINKGLIFNRKAINCLVNLRDIIYQKMINNIPEFCGNIDNCLSDLDNCCRNLQNILLSVSDDIKTASNILTQVDSTIEYSSRFVNYTVSSFSGQPTLSPSDYSYIEKNIRDLLYNEIYYGGDQCGPLILYLNGDENIVKIIKKYYPKMTEEELADYLIAMDEVGCGYVAISNYVIESYADDPEQFEKDFGFPIAYKDEDGNLNSSVNYLFADMYCYVHYQRAAVINPNEDLDDNGAPDFQEYPERYKYAGSSALNKGTFQDERSEILKNEKYKNADVNYCILKERGITPEDDKIYEKIIKDKIDSGNVVELSAVDFTLYDADENGNTIPGSEPQVYIDAPHAMTITDINDNGEYVISTWGGKYTLNPDSLDPYYGISTVHID